MLKEANRSIQRFIPLMFKGFLHAELRIVEAKGRCIQSKSTFVRINEINILGLQFLSELLFPVNPQLILNFRVIIFDEAIELRGTINLCQRVNDLNLFEVDFNLDDLTKAKLSNMIINLAKHYTPLHQRAEYYYTYFSESAYNFTSNRINLLL
jgi:hypothetical protein